MKTCTMMKKGKELNKNIGTKSFHHFIQKLLVPSVRQEVAKPQVPMRSQQNCSKKGGETVLDRMQGLVCGTVCR